MSENQNCSCTWATFRIWGKGVDPAIVTKRLGIMPSEAYSRTPNAETGQIRLNGYWALNSANKIPSTDLEQHIVLLLDMLESAQSELHDLLSDNSYNADIVCYWESVGGPGGPKFSAMLLKRLARLDIGLGMSFYDPCSPEAED